MIHKIQKIKITDSFTTTVEITGNANSGKIVFFSHGFGVQRDARGMFIDIENILKENFLCIRFDYNEIQANGNMLVKSYSFQTITLKKVISNILDIYNPKEKHLIAHSMGNIITASIKPNGFKSIILLAPPILPPYDGLINYFKKRKGTIINPEGKSIIKRSDGTTTFIEKEFLKDMKKARPTELYKQLSKLTNLSIIRPKNDPVIKDSYEEIYKITNINIIEINGDHDFSGNARLQLLSAINIGK